MNKQIYLLLVIFVFSNLAKAQQFALSNQHILNKMSLSPAFAGFNRNAEVFSSFRRDFVGIQGSPENANISISLPQQNLLGFGLQIDNEKIGLFRNTSAKINYAYHLEVSRYSTLSFGISAGFFNNRVDLSEITASGIGLADPYLNFSNDLHGTAFDMGLGIMYNFEGLTVGVAMPRAFAPKISYKIDSKIQYTPARHYLFHASYIMQFDREWYMEPSLVIRTAAGTPLTYEASVMFRYEKLCWVVPQFRKGAVFGVMVGGALSDKLVLNYSYNFHGTELLAISGGTHEVSLGFLIKDGKSDRQSIFERITGGESDIVQRLETLEKNKCCEDNAKRAEVLERQVKALQDQLKNCCDTALVKTLYRQIELLEIEMQEMKQDVNGQIQYEAPFILQNIYFATNSDQLQPTSFPELDKLVQRMNERPNSSILISGYTDNVGDEVYNLVLSRKRAISVKNYLISKGIESDRVRTEGYGMQNPIAPNDTETGRARNRRIEVSFTVQ